MINDVINEDGARIQHIEDLIFWEGTNGIKRAIKTFEELNKDLYKQTSLKWDGSPAVVFGKNERGEFIFTDKSGFSAKGYDGKTKSEEEVEQLFTRRAKGNLDDSRKIFINNMKNAYSIFKNAFPENKKGYYSGDLLYFNTPQIKNNKFIFQPNVVRYEVNVDSELGNKISNSKVGIVIHKYEDLEGKSTSNINVNEFNQGDLLIIPPVFSKDSPKLNLETDETFKLLKRLSNDPSIDAFFNKEELKNKKITDLSKILYTYTNSKVDDNFENLGTDFVSWLKRKINSKNKINNILNHISEYQSVFEKIWKIVSIIHEIKVKFINSLEEQEWPVQSYIGNKKGGEGFVISDINGNLKLVSRTDFTKANRELHKEEFILESITNLIMKKYFSRLKQKMLCEGGNAFDDVSPFKKEEAETIFNSLQEILPSEIKLIKVGSAGKKDISGDMDVMTDESELIRYFDTKNVLDAKNKLKEYLKNKGFDSKLTGTNVHVRVPVKNTDKFAQVDIMVIQNADTISKYHIHDYENTSYKGKHKHVILSSLAKYTTTSKYPDGFIWSPFQGLKDRKTKKIITNDFEKISKILLSNKNATSNDLKSVESILSKLKDKSKLKDAIETLGKEGIELPI